VFIIYIFSLAYMRCVSCKELLNVLHGTNIHFLAFSKQCFSKYAGLLVKILIKMYSLYRVQIGSSVGSWQHTYLTFDNWSGYHLTTTWQPNQFCQICSLKRLFRFVTDPFYRLHHYVNVTRVLRPFHTECGYMAHAEETPMPEAQNLTQN